MSGFEVFISYSRQDEPIVVPIVRLLRLGERGIVFLDLDSIEPGELWRGKLEDALRAAKYVVLFWCSHSSNSREVEREYRAALATGKCLVPVLLDKTPLPPGLSEYQWIDLAALAGATHSHAPSAPSSNPFADLVAPSVPAVPVGRPTSTSTTALPATKREPTPIPGRAANEFGPLSVPAPVPRPMPAPERLPDDFDPFAEDVVTHPKVSTRVGPVVPSAPAFSLDEFFGLGSTSGGADPLSPPVSTPREISEMADVIGAELLRYAKRDGLV